MIDASSQQGEPVKRIAGQPDAASTASHDQRAAGDVGHEVEPPTLVAPPASPWSDGFGRVAVRSAQTLLVLAVGVLLVMVLVRLRLVVVPVLIATLLAAALSPLVRVLHQRGLPRLLATWAALLAGAGAIGLLGWIIVVRVRSESDELVSRASEGLAELERFLTSGPLPIDPNQLSEARTAVVDALRGDEVRSGAVSGATAAAEVVAASARDIARVGRRHDPGRHHRSVVGRAAGRCGVDRDHDMERGQAIEPGRRPITATGDRGGRGRSLTGPPASAGRGRRAPTAGGRLICQLRRPPKRRWRPYWRAKPRTKRGLVRA